MRIFRNLNILLTFYSLLLYFFAVEDKYVFQNPYFNVTFLLVFSSVTLVVIALFFDGKIPSLINFVYNCFLGMNFFRLFNTIRYIEFYKIDELDLNFLISVRRIWTPDELKQRLFDNLATVGVKPEQVDESLLKNLYKFKTMAEIDKYSKFVKTVLVAREYIERKNSYFGFLHKWYDSIVNMDTTTALIIAIPIVLIIGYAIYRYMDEGPPGPHKVKPGKYSPELDEVPTHDEYGNPINPYRLPKSNRLYTLPFFNIEEEEFIPNNDSWKEDHIQEVFMKRYAGDDEELFRALMDCYYDDQYQDYLEASGGKPIKLGGQTLRQSKRV